MWGSLRETATAEGGAPEHKQGIGALAGIRVLDLTRLLPGPFCTRLLADMGADVVKVEDPGRGDYIRGWAPFLPTGATRGTSGYHVVLNRNKRSICINLKEERGRELLRRLAQQADVLVESFRPGVMDAMGLSRAALHKLHPPLVYASISAYGNTHTPPELARRAAHDLNTLARGGLLSYSGTREDEAPECPAAQIADIGSGFAAAFGIVCALLARERPGSSTHGVGQYVDISMADCAMAFTCLRWGSMLGDGKVPAPGTDMLGGAFAAYNVYATSDGRYMSVSALEPQFWKALCNALGHPEWDTPSYFAPGPHQKELKALLAAAFRARSQEEWIAALGKVDCCVEPVLNLDEVMASKMAMQRGMVEELVHAQWGAYKQLGCCCSFGDAPPRRQERHAPELGEHTTEVLAEYGINATTVAELKAANVVAGM